MKRLTALMLALAMMISVFVPNLSAAYMETMAEDASSIAEEAADASSLRDSQSEEEEEDQSASDPEASASAEPEGGESSDEQKPQGQKAKKAETSRKQKTPKQGIYGKNFDPKQQAPELKHLKKTLKTVDGVTYRLTVSYDKNAGIPDDAKLSVVELNQALTEEELEKKENKKRPYNTERFVSEKALEQDTFDLQQGLKVRKKDYVLFTKFLDLSLTADGKEVQPKAPVTVTLETDVVEEGASDALEAAVLDEKATEQWQKEREKLVKKQEKQLKSGKLKEKDVQRFPERVFRSLKVTNETKKKKGTRVSFRLKEFTCLGVAGVAKRLKSWKVKDETVCVYGPRGLKAKVRKETLKIPKAGMEKVRAFSVKPNEKKNPGYDVTFWVGGVPEQYKTTQDDAAQDNAAQDDVAQDDAAQDNAAQDDAARDDAAQDDAAQDDAAQDDAALSTMSDEEPDTGVVVSELKRGGRTGRTLIGIGGSSAPVAIQSGKSVGLLWDTGLREQSVEAEQVSVEGLLPKNAQVSAEDMLWRYSRPEEVVEDVGEEAETLAAYDITISGRQGEFQPDKGESVSVSIRDESISSRKKLEVWHLKDDGSVEVIRDFSVKGDTISFDASGFSVYLVVQVSKEQTVTAGDGKTYKITVTYDSDAGIPEDAELQVSELDAKGKDYQKYVKKTAKKLETKEKNFAFAHAFDIALVDPETGKHCQPAKPLSVSVKLLKEDVDKDSDIDVVHFGDKTEVLESSVNGKSIEFETDGFSVYVVSATTCLCTYRFYTFNEAGSRTEYMFESENGEFTSSVTLKNGEILTAPQNPANPSDDNAVFLGWFAATADNTEFLSDGTPKNLEADAFDFSQPQNNTAESTTVSLYAVFSDVLYVRLHGYKENGSSVDYPVIQTVTLPVQSTNSITINLRDYATASYHDSSANGAFRAYEFVGWSEEKRNAGQKDTTHDLFPPTDPSAPWEYTVTKDVDLYPVFTAVRWLIPVSGKAGTSATYFPPISFHAENGPTSLSEYVPTRPGYDFVGWYLDVENRDQTNQNGCGVRLTDEKGTFVSGFNDTAHGVALSGGKLSLSNDVEIYARWRKKADPVSYTIVVWKQLPTEAYDAAEKHYEYVKSISLSGTADENVTISVADYTITATEGSTTHTETLTDTDFTRADYQFHNAAPSDTGTATIKPKGNRVFHLYYDRKDTASPTAPQGTYTLTFDQDGSTTTSYPEPGAALGTLRPADPATDSRPGYIPDDAPWPQGYTYSWYLDQSYSTRVFFSDNEEYQNYDGSKALYETMPTHNLTLYGRWMRKRFRVDIDPNYGALYTNDGASGTSGTGSTWFSVDYGEQIEEYTHVTRDYVASESGDYYYHSSPSDRKTYYTQDITAATELTTFKYQPGLYNKAGWYEVHDDGTETPYTFGSNVEHNTKLRLHWKLTGTYYLEYNTQAVLNGKTIQGTLLKGDEARLSSGYSDQSIIFLTGAATPPGGYDFIGWRVRGDESETIYCPGESITLPAEYAVTMNGIEKVFLDAVYAQSSRAKIVYNANGGTISLNKDEVNFGGPTDPNAPTPKKSVASDGQTATISNLLDNSEVTLSSGEGFSCTVNGQPLTFTGWYQEKDDGTRTLFRWNSTAQCYEDENGQPVTLCVDVNEPVTLYARWAVKVCFDLNRTDASFGTGWDGYTQENGQKTIIADLNCLLDEPQGTIATTDGTSLDYWSKDSAGTQKFEFRTDKVTEPLTLYAQYTDQKSVTFHVLEQDGTGAAAVYMEKPNWQSETTVRLSPVAPKNIPNDLSGLSVPTDYNFQFAYAGTAINPSVSDDDHITAVKNDSGTLKVTKGGNEVDLAAGQDLWLVYAPSTPLEQDHVNIVYMKESAGGALTKIQGYPDGITYNGTALTMNGHTVAQNQRITVTHDIFPISQDMSGSAFHMPPLLDEGENRLNLVYDRIGVGYQTEDPVGTLNPMTNISQLTAASAQRRLSLKIEENRLQWRFQDTDRWNRWTPFGQEKPTIYVIYRERGYELTLEKTVTKSSAETGIDPEKRFKVTIESTAITRESYEAEGTGYHSVAATPAANAAAGKIILYVKDGSHYKIKGLSRGNYTITEELTDTSFVRHAKVTAGGSTSNVPDGDVIALTDTHCFQSDTTVELSNEPQPICRITNGEQEPLEFYTLNSALRYLGEHRSGEGKIYMLRNYAMPAADALEIPEGYEVTLDSWDSTTPNTITRDASFTNAPMFTNNGTLMLLKVTLDGGALGQSAPNTNSPTIRNEGTLTVGEHATLQNAFSSRNGGAIYSTGPLTLNGTLSSNRTTGNGGAVYYIGSGEVTVSGGTISDNSATDGGALYCAGTGVITVSGGTVSGNTASGNGGALCAEGGTIQIQGGTISGNAATVNGGGIYLTSGVLRHTGGTISDNSALNGGGIYADSCDMTVSGGTLTGNHAASNGGGVFLGSGGLVVEKGTLMNGNSADNYGGALYTSAGTITVSGGTIGAAGTPNSAKNGAAVFVDKGNAVFSGGSITNNSAVKDPSETGTIATGGAVGIGSDSVKLEFSGNLNIKDNTWGNVKSNVYLDQDTESIINAGGLSNSYYVGIYVPNRSKTVEGQLTEYLFKNRGDIGAKFGTYSGSGTTVPQFKNDREANLQAVVDSSTKQLYWSCSIIVEVRYLLNFDTLPNGTTGESKYFSDTYYPAVGNSSVSALADELRDKCSKLSTTAVYATALVEGDTSYEHYLTRLLWEDGKWKIQKRNSTSDKIDFDRTKKIIIYFSEPTYLSVENNTTSNFVIDSLTLTNSTPARSVLNSADTVGYGLVFAKNGSIQSELLPVEKNGAGQYVLAAGDSVNLLIPGHRNKNFYLNGNFSDSGVFPVSLKQNGQDKNDLTKNPVNLTGTTKNDSTTYEIIFGGEKEICKIKCAVSGTVATSEYVRCSPATPGNGTPAEYTFSSLKKAITFANVHNLSGEVKIEMLTDYLMPSGDVVMITNADASDYLALPNADKITFTTATTAADAFTYPGTDPDRRATISRANGNTSKPMITVVTNDITALKVQLNGLNFNGRSLTGTCDGGALRTVNCQASVEKVDISNFISSNGGGIFVAFGDESKKGDTNQYDIVPYYGEATKNLFTLTVKEANFWNCHSEPVPQRSGGGAVWTNARKLDMSDCYFDTCSAKKKDVDQGGAVFHRIEATNNTNFAVTPYWREAETRLTDCHFTNCTAAAGGGIESDATNIYMTRCDFTNCSTIKKNGGAINVYIYQQSMTSNTTASEMHLTDCQFTSCTAKQGGGAIRSLALDTELINCTFTNTTATGDSGGALFVNNTAAQTTTIKGCTFTGTKAPKNGGAIYTASKTLSVGYDERGETKKPTTITGCQATSENGGGICHSNNVSGSSTSLTGCIISDCTSKKSGGGVYTTARKTILTGCTIQSCKAKTDGGGLYSGASGNCIYDSTTGEYADNSEYYVIVDSSTIRGNEASDKGGGLFVNNTALTLRNDTVISGNKLNSANKVNCAGVYLKDGRTLTVGSYTATKADSSSVVGNTLNDTSPSNMRLSSSNNVNKSDSVKVLCNLSGEIRVINAAKKSTKFGVTKGKLTSGFTDSGFKEMDHTFIADDDSLYGVFDRTDDDTDGWMNVIWRGDVICKLTDKNGALLYLDQEGNEPAIFDRLDGKYDDGKPASAFGFLRGANAKLYYEAARAGEPGEQFDQRANDICVKLLVETITPDDQYPTSNSNNNQNTTGTVAKHIILTTAGSTDAYYRYTGRSGTYSVIQGASGKNIIETKIDLSLRNVTLDGGKRGIYCNTDNKTITLQKSAVIKNMSNPTDQGGGVYVQNSSFVLNGGTIYNCIGKNGGGVYHKGNGSVTILAGTISGCSAVGSSEGLGGGVCLYQPNGTPGTVLTMSGGMINGCSANRGGGIYLYKYTLDMSGGKITNNNATQNGGGIAMDAGGAKMYFSRQVTVSGNKLNGSACNVQLDRDSNEVIYSYNLAGTESLGRGSFIGVYVPDTASGNSTLYNRHGKEGMPFGTWDKTGSDTEQQGKSKYLYCFVNDRNSYKGGLMNGNSNIYWVKIYSLKISKQVLSDKIDEMGEKFQFKVRFFTMIGGERRYLDASQEYPLLNWDGEDLGTIKDGDIITLKSGQTKMVDKLPEKIDNSIFYYEVEEQQTANMYENSELKYTTTTYNSTGTSSPYTVTGYIGEGRSNAASSECLSVAAFTNQRAICKLTYVVGNNDCLLYYEDPNTKRYLPAVYSELYLAFNKLNATNSEQPLYYKNPYTDAWTEYTASTGDSCNVEMLIQEYLMGRKAELNADKTAVLTTAQSDATDGYPYVGRVGTLAKIIRNFTDSNLLRVTGSLTLTDITLDGNGTSKPTGSGVYGGLVSVRPMGQVTIQDGAVLENAKSDQDGGAVYVNENATLNITGGTIQNNQVTGSYNGAAIYVKGNPKTPGKVCLSGTPTIIGNTCANGNGAGIYLAEGAKLELSGKPDFGGSDLKGGSGEDKENLKGTDGNFVFKKDTEDDKPFVYQSAEANRPQNGGKPYPVNSADESYKVRQDIFIAGYQSSESGATNAASLVIKGKITSGDGTIWVWAQEKPHYRSLEQFAVLDAGLVTTNNGVAQLNTAVISQTELENTLKAFRNARPDTETDAGKYKTYLNGMTMKRDTTQRNVFWYGIEGSAHVMLVKVGESYEALSGVRMSIYTDHSMTESSLAHGTIWSNTGEKIEGYELKNLTSSDGGAFFIGELPFGTYYVKEEVVSDGSAANEGYVTPTGKHFEFTVDGDGVVKVEGNTSIPVKTLTLVDN